MCSTVSVVIYVGAMFSNARQPLIDPPTLEPYSIIETREHNVSMDICKNQLLFAGASILETPLHVEINAIRASRFS